MAAGSKAGSRRFFKLLVLSGSLFLSFVFIEVAVRALIPVRNVGPSFTTYDPYYGRSLKVNESIRRITPEFEMQMTTNSLGYRGPEPRLDAEETIVFIGDSFTLGYGVTDGSEFPQLTRELLRERLGNEALEVVNMGMGDAGNGRWIKLLRRDVTAYSPGLIVFQFCQNDLRDNVREHHFSLNDEGLLVEGPIPAPSRSDSVQKVIESVPGLADTYAIGLMRQVRSPFDRQSTPTRASASQESRGQQANEMKLTEPERLAVALLGESIRLAKASAWPSVLVVQASDGLSPALTQAFESFKVPLLYVPSKSERPEFYFEIDGHWNEAGHLYVSEKLSDLIVERGVL